MTRVSTREPANSRTRDLAPPLLDSAGGFLPTSSTVQSWPYHPAVDDISDDDWLLPLQERRSLFGDLRFILRRELWTHRGLLYELTRRDIRVRYKQAVMGLVWAVLMPVLIVAAGALVRVAMAFVGGRPLVPQEVVGIAIKAVPWAFFVGALGFGINSLTGNSNLVTKIYFPREVLPLASTLAQMFDSSIGLGALLLVCLAVGVDFGLAAWWAIPLLGILVAFTAGSALLVGCANLFFRDVKYIVQVLLSFGIFFTPVFFEPQMFGPTGARVMMLNPVAPILEGLRLSIVYDHNLLTPVVEMARKGAVLVWSPWYLAYSAGWSVVMLTGGLLIFHRTEPKFAEYV
jgi:homopolymeric O-antigen transport system permease protein